MQEEDFPSPDGRYKVTISSIPMLMSHEVECPTLIDNQTNQVIFHPGSLWEGDDVAWSEDSSTLNMHMMQYPDGQIDFEITIQPGADKAELKFGDRVIFTGTLQEVSGKMKVSKKSGMLTKKI